MAKPKRGKPPTYTPAPLVQDPRVAERLEAVLQVMNGVTSVSEAARQLHLPRNHFQSLLHRGQTGLLEGLTPKPAGRPPTPPAQQTLTSENQRLRRQLVQTQLQLTRTEKLLEAAGEILREQSRAGPPRGMGPRKHRTRRPAPDESG
jgi:transposase-like protein